jgi:hypothetical protein
VSALDRRGTPVAAWPLGTKRTPLLVLYLFFFRITSRTAWTNFERKWMRSDIRSEAMSRPAGQPEKPAEVAPKGLGIWW